MKSIYIAVAVAVVLIAGAIGYSAYVSNIADTLKTHTVHISDEIEAENFEAAMNAAEELDRELESKKTLLCAVVDHKDIYEITRSLDELKCYLGAEEESDSLAYCAAIVAVTEKISDNALPYIFNIL